MKTACSSKESYIFVASIKLRDGRVIYAKDYGKKAFRIMIRDGKI